MLGNKTMIYPNKAFRLFLFNLTISFLAVILSANAQTNYYTIGNGAWKNTSKWIPSYPGETITEGDSVFVMHNMTISSIRNEINVRGVLTIESAGNLSGNKKIKTSAFGYVINNGTISLNNEIHIDGTLYNNNNIEINKLHIDGYLCNPGTINIDSGQKIDLHGGLIECGGSLITDEIKIHNNNGTGGRAILREISICDNEGNDPIIDFQSGTIDSATVIICGLSLPVELYTYEVKLTDNNVVVEWSTASEINNDYFVVERSRDAYSFEEISMQEGAGNSDAFQYYVVIDRFPFEGISYYRLKQVDYNEKTTYFDIKMVNNNDSYTDKHDLKVFPNPINGHSQFNIKLEGFEGGTVQIKIQNMNGYLVYSDEINISQQGELITLETNIIQNNGMYMVSVFNNDSWYHHKFMFIK